MGELERTRARDGEQARPHLHDLVRPAALGLIRRDEPALLPGVGLIALPGLDHRLGRARMVEGQLTFDTLASSSAPMTWSNAAVAPFGISSGM